MISRLKGWFTPKVKHPENYYAEAFGSTNSKTPELAHEYEHVICYDTTNRVCIYIKSKLPHPIDTYEKGREIREGIFNIHMEKL